MNILANLTGLGALTRLNWASWMAQRSFFFLLAFGWLITPLIYLFVWATAAGGRSVGGYTRDGFIVYYLALMLVNQFTFTTANWTVGDAIHEGYMNDVLLRPITPFMDALGADLAGKGVFLAFDVPVVLGLALILRPEVSFTPGAIVAFIPALIFAALLRFLAGYALALLAFWSTRADALLALQDALIFVLAGQVAPLALLPDALQTVARVLPFRFMLSFPLEVLTGEAAGADLLAGFALQLAWLIVAGIVAWTIWRAGVRRYSALGG
jgi:ABC-2 type transport system permease protein